MRALALLIALAPITAYATPEFKDVVVHGAKQAPPGAPKKFTQISHLIYMNRCAGGCPVLAGNFEDAVTHHSSIPQQNATLAAYPYGDAAWNSLVQCVRDMYAPFDIQVTDQDPGTAARTELLVAGHAVDIGVPGAGGVAPFVPCEGEQIDNTMTFVFALETNNADFLCWAAAQETSHVFGLDHELLATDPMTYLTPPVKKPGFQNMPANCGENTPRVCACGGQQQNSAQFLMDMFGPAHLDPATLTITSPADGAWVKPGFAVHATSMSQLSVKSSKLSVDGVAGDTGNDETEIVLVAPTVLAGGDHTVHVDATDSAARTYGSEITVHVTATCSDSTPCAQGKCLGGFCLPESDVTGGLGATCATGGDCITGTCAVGGDATLCTAPCDPGMTCPGGYTCVATSADAGVCWPAPESSGCATNNGAGALGAFAGLGVLLAFRRRRR